MVETELVQVGPYEVPVEREHVAPAKPAKGAPCFDYMVDLETTGLNPNENGVLQIACVRFNRLTKEVDHKWFDRCLTVPAGRYWDEGTRDWWMDKPDVLTPILQRAEPPAVVVQAFYDWILEGSSIMPRVLWAKPTSFEYPFLASYFRQFGFSNPFHYREAVDLNSYLLGRGHENRRKFWDTVEPIGAAHNAVNDCLYQIRAVLQS